MKYAFLLVGVTILLMDGGEEVVIRYGECIIQRETNHTVVGSRRGKGLVGFRWLWWGVRRRVGRY